MVDPLTTTLPSRQIRFQKWPTHKQHVVVPVNCLENVNDNPVERNSSVVDRGRLVMIHKGFTKKKRIHKTDTADE